MLLVIGAIFFSAIGWLTVAIAIQTVLAIVFAARAFARRPTGSARRQPCEAERAGLAAAIEQVAEAVVVTDAEGVIVYVNPAFSAITGYTAAEALGSNPRILKSGRQEQSFYEEMWATIRSGRIWRGSLVNRRKDGTRYTEEMTITPVLDDCGVIFRYIAIKQDVTARRSGEHAQRLLAALAESSEDAIVVHGPDVEILSWNRGAEILFGYGSAEALCKRITMLIPSDRADLYPGMVARLQRGERVAPFEGAAIRKDGARIEVSLTLSAIREATDKLTAIAVIARDITARKQGERSRQILASIVDCAQDAIVAKGLDGCIVSWNRAAELMYGYTATEVIGEPVTILIPPISSISCVKPTPR